MQISMKISQKLKLRFLMGIVKHSQSFGSKFVMSLQYLKKELWDEFNFLYTDKHQSFLQVDFNTLGSKVSYKVILSLLMCMIKHSRSTQRNEFTMSSQYLKKEVRNGVHFLHADKRQSWHLFFHVSGQKCPRYPKYEAGNNFAMS